MGNGSGSTSLSSGTSAGELKMLSCQPRLVPIRNFNSIPAIWIFIGLLVLLDLRRHMRVCAARYDANVERGKCTVQFVSSKHPPQIIAHWPNCNGAIRRGTIIDTCMAERGSRSVLVCAADPERFHHSGNVKYGTFVLGGIACIPICLPACHDCSACATLSHLVVRALV